jgi:hypothetical protein
MKTINFSNIDWDVKQGDHLPPRCNNWKDDNVRVDEKGWLHLKIRKDDETWYSSEIVSKNFYGYGEYLFYVIGKIDDYDPMIILGMFSYRDDKNEVDIEIANFGDLHSNKKSVFHTVQDDRKNGKFCTKAKLNLQGDATSHKIIRSPSQIEWQSYYGHYESPPSSLILKTIAPIHKPVEKAKIHINFFLYNACNGLADKSKKEAEIIIKHVNYRRLI